jgi:hypothetical protein
MTDDRLKTESAGRLGGDCREVARRAGVEVGGVRACRSIILAEPGAAGFAGIAAFSSLLPKEAGFGTYLEAGASECRCPCRSTSAGRSLCAPFGQRRRVERQSKQ